MRLDKFISLKAPAYSRSQIQELIKAGAVSVDGQTRKTSYILKKGQSVAVQEPEGKDLPIQECSRQIPVIFQDSHIVVVEKPENLTVHPPHAAYRDTLVNALIRSGIPLWGPDPLRPGVVHRLDKETSGVMVLAKNKNSYESLVSQFKNRSVTKEYRSLVWGRIERDHFMVTLPLTRDSRHRLRMKIGFTDGKNASTKAEVIRRFPEITYLRLNLPTGRMHQIRVHLSFIGNPVIGDRKYGKKDGYKSLMLHAHTLGFCHPSTQDFMTFSSPVPQRFDDIIGSCI